MATEIKAKSEYTLSYQNLTVGINLRDPMTSSDRRGERVGRQVPCTAEGVRRKQSEAI